MITARLLAGMIAVMSLSAAGSVVSPTKSATAERDSRIIVEVARGIEGLDENQIKSSQTAILNRIRSNVTNNVELVDSFSRLNNAFVIEVNSQNIEQIRSLPGVASVTVDKLHAHKSIGEGSTYTATLREAEPNPVVEENISASTMGKPSNTNDGEGTAIAILDNEFFLRGNHTEKDDCSFHKYGCTGDQIHHEVYSDLDPSTHVKYTFDNLTDLVKKTHAKRKSKAMAGDEGSLYFNRKVPFYYDYGGESTAYGKAGPMDYDVSSIIAYHGSHVSSIAAANAPTYAGISPKAQLVCMKVFTNYKADDTAKNLGFGDSSGAYDSCILAALEDCIALGVDGINMSLGSDLDDFDSNSITLKTLSNLANGGIMTAISAGNSGKSSYSFTGGYGNWTRDMVETGIMSSYANNKASMTVASGQPDKVYFETAIKLGTENVQYEDQIVNREGLDAEYNTEFRLTDLIDTHGSTIGWQYIPGFGTQADYSGKDVEGKVAVVNRGSTSFADKYAVAKDNGAIALIIINNDPTASDFNFRCSFGDDFMPSMPCALVLFKDKGKFSSQDSGTYTYIQKEVSDNADKRTISSYSTDGATYDYDLKPEITAPGELVRGAVPPQKKEDKELTPLNTYEYLSGTSMSAPNYAGSQALVLSKVAKDMYSTDGTISSENKTKLNAFRKTVDMRLMSTAVPMLDKDPNPETNVKVLTSPRLQGAGMVNLEGAYNTDVYFESKEAPRKSKVVLKNNDDIANGNLKLSFKAHNESEETRLFDAKLTVMRPAIKEANDVIAREYNFRSEVDNVKYIPGITYYDVDLGRTVSTGGKAAYRDVFKLTKQIEYYPNEAAYERGEEGKVIMAQGLWYVSSQGTSQTSNVKYDVLPSHKYQSVLDTVIDEVEINNIEIPAGDSEVNIPEYKLSSEVKDQILELFPSGCAIEGFVTFTSKDGHEDLNIPYLGFYSGADKNDGASYKSAPVVEPFNFEKDSSVIYPSDLVNDVTKSLVGKDNVDFSSMWLTGYVDNPTNLNTEKVLTNDLNWKMLNGFHEIGLDPLTGKYSTDGKLVAGNPEHTNTMIIQQFVMRSVNDNYFTITNKATGKVVYKSVLEDMLFGEQYGRYPLYKSHIDASYLSAGYAAHRAYAVVPMYDTLTNEKFASGEYDVTFNYQLVGCNNEWVSKSYTIVIDSSNPEFSSISERTVEGTQMVRFEFKDEKLSYAIVGYQLYDVNYDAEKDVYYVEIEKDTVNEIIEEIGEGVDGQSRMYVKMIDKAYGETGLVVHFTDPNDYSKYEAITGSNVQVNFDFTHDSTSIKYYSISVTGVISEVDVKNAQHYGFNINPQPVPPGPTPAPENNNLGLILGLSIGGGCLVLGGAAVLVVFLLKKKKLNK